MEYQSQIAEDARFVVVSTAGPALIGRDLGRFDSTGRKSTTSLKLTFCLRSWKNTSRYSAMD